MQLSAPESLERRALLAFSPLPVGPFPLDPDNLDGDLIEITTDAADPLNEISIILDDKTNAGFVTATITTKVNGAPDQVGQYYNFSGISFTSVNDTDGSVVNKVSLWTSYDADLTGYEIAPSDDASVGLSANWQVYNEFPAGVSLGETVLVDLWNADALTVTSGILGGGDSTIRGEFESPTLPENIDPNNPDTYANIALFSGVGIANAPLNAAGDLDAIVASALTLKSQTAGINLSQDVFTKYDLTMEAALDITLDNVVEVQEGNVSLFSSSGSIAVLDLIHAMAGSITIDSECASVDIVRLCALEDITINAPQGVTVSNELRSETGGVAITADAGPMRIRDVFTEDDIIMSAAESVTLVGLLEATSGKVDVNSLSGAILLQSAQLHAVDNTISLNAHSRIVQNASGGVSGVTVLTPGLLPGLLTDPLPVVQVDLAPPVRGQGLAATAQAVIRRDVISATEVIFSIAAIVLTSPGSGYEINEPVAVTITGLPGASAVGVGPRWAEHIIAQENVTLAAGDDIKVTTVVRSNAGDVAITSIDGSIDLSSAEPLVHALQGTIFVESKAGDVSVEDLNSGAGIEVFGFTGVRLSSVQQSGDVAAASGDIRVVSLSGSIQVAAALNATGGGIFLEAHQDVKQEIGSGVQGITLLNGGQRILPVNTDPEVTVTIAPPIAGGLAAQAVPVLGFVAAGVGFRQWFISDIILTDGGNGYGLNEDIRVTISGMPGAAAEAIGPGQSQSLVSSGSFSIVAGGGIEIVSTVTSRFGDVSVIARDGAVNLGTEGQVVNALSGSILLESISSSVRVADLNAGGGLKITSGSNLEASGLVRGEFVAIESVAGSLSLVSIASDVNVDMRSLGDIEVTGGVSSRIGDVSIFSTLGDVTVRDRVYAEFGSIALTVQNGVLTHSPLFSASGYSTPLLQAGGAVTIVVDGVDPISGRSAELASVISGGSLSVSAIGSVRTLGEVTALSGDITLTSLSGSVDFTSTDIHARVGSLKISSHGSIQQQSADGILSVTVVSQGQEPLVGSPAVTVTIDAPLFPGGRAATAVASTRIVGYQAPSGEIIIPSGSGRVIVPEDATPVWGLSGILLVDPGSGYAQGETPTVAITGIAGAAAKADGPAAVPFNVTAGSDIEFTAGEHVELTSTVRSDRGDVSVIAIDGNVNLGAEEQLVHAAEGSIQLESIAGGVAYQRVIAGEDITLRSHNVLTINNQLTTGGGDVTLASTGNDVALEANVLAAGTLTISAKTGISQAGGSVKAGDLVLENISGAAISLGSQGNDVDRLAAKNVGDIAFVDADGFRVGIETVGPMGIAVSGNAVSLSSAAAGSVIRVVGGLRYSSLSIAAGTLGGENAGTVEFVTTTNSDNAGTPANPLATGYNFTGSLRDMIRYANDNSATVAVGGVPRQQPQVMVFDEVLLDAFNNPLPAVSTIKIETASLPAFTRPITFDGGRVQSSVPGGRLGLMGRSGLPTGLHLGHGSTGSTLTGAAVFGFSTGSGILIESSDNTVDNTFVGLRSNGSTVSPNRLGINISGVRANSNTIGTAVHTSLTDGVVANLPLINRGELAAGAPPVVTVTIAPPIGGGTTATAQAVVQEIRPGVYGVTRLVLTNPGSGYEIGENPAVTIVGMPGASAVSVVTVQTEANHFAGNSDAGIVVQRGASNNRIFGNVIGVPGRTPNRTGVRIDGGSGNQIGTAAQITDDMTPTPSNLIRGNTHYGIELRNVRGATTVVENNVISHNATKEGQGAHGIGVLNSANVRIGGASELASNQIHSQAFGAGVHLSGSNNVTIVGNRIGTDGYHLSADAHWPDALPVWPSTGSGGGNSAFLGNGRHGIDVFGRSRDVEITANRIVDNRGSGVAIASGSTGVVLSRNEIGAWIHPVTGNMHAAGNQGDGVTITAANGNTIAFGNVIGHNLGSGVAIENSVAAGLATGNKVIGSEIFGNLGHGVNISGSSRQTVGGAGGDDGNIIRQNALDGVRIAADPRIRASAAPQGNLVTGNFIGTNDNEEVDRSWGNRTGISVVDGSNNTITRNVVMNNRDQGIEIAGGTANTVGGSTATQGNFVGYNFGDGVLVHDQASTNRNVGVVATAITNPGAGYAASRTNVIFSAPVASGGTAARGAAIVSATGRVTGILLTSGGTGYAIGETVTVTIFDPLATTQATATVTLGTIQAVSPASRGHVVGGNEIEANGGVGIYVRGDRVSEVQVGQNSSDTRNPGVGNKISFHSYGVLIDAARRTRVQGNMYSDNDSPMALINGANQMVGSQLTMTGLQSTPSGTGQTLVTGQIVNAGAFQQYWVDVYQTPYWDISYDVDGNAIGHQMRRLLGRALVTTDGFGNATLRTTISQSLEIGDYVSVVITSALSEPGSTVGVFHSQVEHGTTQPSGTTVIPTTTSGTTGQVSYPSRGPVPPSRL